MGNGPLPRLLALTDDRVIEHGGVVERAARMAEAAGPLLCVGLRSRALADGALTALALDVAGAVRPHGSWLAISGRADIARGVKAEMVLAGRGAMATADLKRVYPAARVARSAHSVQEARADEADAIIAGPIFRTSSHPNTPALGTGLIVGVGAALVAAQAGKVPIFAVGGMTTERTRAVLDTGAWGVAAISALWDAADPAEAAAAFAAVLPRDETIAVTINGEQRRTRAGLTLDALLADLELDPRGVVVERNRQIVRRDALAATPVLAGDSLELVHFVGGG